MLVTAENLSFGYRSRAAEEIIFDRASFSVGARSITALVGPSGGGKSTLLRLIAGSLKPTSGTVDCEPALTSRLVYHPQEAMLLPWLSVRDNVLLGLAFRRVPAALDWDDLVEALSLAPILGKYPAELSGGQSERAALARSLIMPAQLYLLDEPLGGTDYMLRVKIEEYLRRLVHASGASIVIVTHDLPQAVAVSDQMLVVPRGRSVHEVPVPPELAPMSPAQRRESPLMGPAVGTLATALEGVDR